jgi:hypothetical protein
MSMHKNICHNYMHVYCIDDKDTLNIIAQHICVVRVLQQDFMKEKKGYRTV